MEKCIIFVIETNEKIDDMTTLEKIQSAATQLTINKIKADIEYIMPEYKKQDINKAGYLLLTEMISVNSMKKIKEISSLTHKMYGPADFLLTHEIIDKLS